MCLPIGSFARMLTGALPGKGYLLLLRFYCDASFDSDPKLDQTYTNGKYVPRTFVVGGFLATDTIWEKIQDRWAGCNQWACVSRYHAAEVNALDGEYTGWSKEKQIEYSKRLLATLGDQGTELCAISIGLKVRDYEKTISEEGRRKWGNHYVVCFKQAISYIAQLMGNLPTEDKFAVILERDKEFENDAVEIFYSMKDDLSWGGGLGRRLAACAPGNPEEIIPLQAADLIAYETFRYLDSDRDPRLVRPALKALLPHNEILGKWWNAELLLLEVKGLVENAPVVQNRFIALWDNEDLEKYRFVRC